MRAESQGEDVQGWTGQETERKQENQSKYYSTTSEKKRGKPWIQ